MIGVFLSHARELSRAQRVLATIAAVAVLVLPASAQADPIRGAGSTFAAPIINQWSRDYETVRGGGTYAPSLESCDLCRELAARDESGARTSLDWRVDYEPTGSLAGIMRLAQPEVDFAATDAPLSAKEVERRGLAQFPIVMGGIAVVANLEEVGEIRVGSRTGVS